MPRNNTLLSEEQPGSIHETLVRNLIETQRGPCVSLTYSTHRAGKEVQQDRMRLKNALSEAKKRLQMLGSPAGEIEEITAPARELLEHGEFWRNQQDGLAIYLSPGTKRLARLPIPVPETVTVGRQFYVLPLFAALNRSQPYYLLALSQNAVKLYRSADGELKQVDNPDLPQSLQDVLRFVDSETQLQFMVQSLYPSFGRAGERQRFHGHGGAGAGAQERTARIIELFRAVDRALMNSIGNSKNPLIVASTDPLFWLFKGVTSYPCLLPTPVAGNPEARSLDDLAQAAEELLAAAWQDELESQYHQYEERRGSDLTACSPVEAAHAAFQGGIDSLLVPLNSRYWGKIRITSNGLEVSGTEDHDGEELLNFTACHTFANSGKVNIIDGSMLGPDEALAATLRQPLSSVLPGSYLSSGISAAS